MVLVCQRQLEMTLLATRKNAHRISLCRILVPSRKARGGYDLHQGTDQEANGIREDQLAASGGSQSRDVIKHGEKVPAEWRRAAT